MYTNRRYKDVIQVVMDSTGTTCPHLKYNLLWNYRVEIIMSMHDTLIKTGGGVFTQACEH